MPETVRPPDVTLHDGDAAHDEFVIPATELPDDPVFERVNLSTRMTGVVGIITISTDMAGSQPHVRWSAKAGRDEPGFSVLIGEYAIPAATGVEGSVQRWVDVNRDALLRFWSEGDTRVWDEVSAFCDALQPDGGTQVGGAEPVAAAVPQG